MKATTAQLLFLITQPKDGEMSELSDRDACLLWGQSGGYCNNPVCRQPLFRFARPRTIGNAGERAHIVGKKPDAARGDPDRSPELAALLSNHILLCAQCHKMIDDNPLRFPEDTLTAWKAAHEERVTTLLSAGLGAKPTVAIHVKARFGAGEGRILNATVQQMMDAALQTGHYFDDRIGLKIVDADDARRDSNEGYWDSVENTLQTRLQAQLAAHGQLAHLAHISLFASGPIPLLVALGRLIGDTREVDVRDFDRDTSSWLWPALSAPSPDFTFHPGQPGPRSDVAIIIELSGRIDRDAVSLRLSSGVPQLLIDVPHPLPGLIKSPAHLSDLRRVFRAGFESAKAMSGDDSAIHVFAAMPLSAAVAFGQCQLPKAMPTIHIYDNNIPAGGWRRALTFKGSQEGGTAKAPV